MVLIKDPAMTHPLRVCVSVCVGVCECLRVCPCMCQISISMTGGGVLQYVGRCLRTPPPPPDTHTRHKKIKTLSHIHMSTIILATTKADRKHQTCEGNRARQAKEQKVRGYGTLKGQSFSLLWHQEGFRFYQMVCATFSRVIWVES